VRTIGHTASVGGSTPAAVFLLPGSLFRYTQARIVLAARMALSIGLIGAGEVATLHAGILAADPRVRVAGVYDNVPERAEAFGRRFGCPAQPSLDAVLAASQAVYICTPNTTHAELALAVLAAGRHVFCEKPFAIQLEDARRVHEAAARTKVVFQVGHNRRFAPVYQFLKEAIAGGRLQPHAVHARMNRGELLRPPWVWNSRLTGGFLYETPVHMFDLMRFFFGEVQWVQAAAQAREHGEWDDFSLLLNFASGVHATMTTYGHATWHFPFERFEVFGHHATYETFEMERIAYTTALDAPTTTLDYSQLSRNERWGYAQEDRMFVDALEGRGTAPVTPDDGLKVVQLITACYAGARSGERIYLQPEAVAIP
jgi:myo-inositol 2-dehydrogenase/D-chiro-inositol 1-dehydrogenase